MTFGQRKPAKPKPPKPKTCKCGCKVKFVPARPMQVAATPDCAIKMAEKARIKKEERAAKAERAKTRAEKMEAKPPQYWLKRAEAAVNAYVRFRDRELPCISCGTWDTVRWEAGHFIPVGRSSFLRYDLSNIARQCHRCNCMEGGRMTDYEARVRFRIGDAEVDRLKAAPRMKIWEREELQAIEAEFKEKLKQAQKEASDFSCA